MPQLNRWYFGPLADLQGALNHGRPRGLGLLGLDTLVDVSDPKPEHSDFTCELTPVSVPELPVVVQLHPPCVGCRAQSSIQSATTSTGCRSWAFLAVLLVQLPKARVDVRTTLLPKSKRPHDTTFELEARLILPSRRVREHRGIGPRDRPADNFLRAPSRLR